MTKNEVYIVSAVRTPLGSFGGVFANFLRQSLESMGITEEMWGNTKKINFGDELDAAQAEAKAWKTIWSAGQGVSSIEDRPSTKDLIDRLKKEFIDSIKNQGKVLEKFS